MPTSDRAETDQIPEIIEIAHSEREITPKEPS